MTYQEKRTLLRSNSSAKILWYADIVALGYFLIQNILATISALQVWGGSQVRPDNVVFAVVLAIVNGIFFLSPALTAATLWGVLRLARWAIILLIIQGGFIFLGLGVTSDYQSLTSTVVPILVMVLILWSYWRVVRATHQKTVTSSVENPRLE